MSTGMKIGLKPTKRQKDFISRKGFNPEVWLVFSDDVKAMTIIHKVTAKKEVLSKE